LYLVEKLWPIFCWLLWRPGRSFEQNGRLVYSVACLAPALMIGGCLLFGWLAPAGYRHWMDVALVALLLLAPRWLGATGSHLREGIPQALFGWDKAELVSWRRA